MDELAPKAIPNTTHAHCTRAAEPGTTNTPGQATGREAMIEKRKEIGAKIHAGAQV